MLIINEVFESIQGEATHTGRPSIFIRLQGCPVGCSFCDTKYTWSNSVGVSDEDIFTRRKKDGGHAWQEDDLLDEIQHRYTARHIVITGGEPCTQEIHRLCNEAIFRRFSVQLETSGTYEINVPQDVFVTVSPKINMAGGKVILEECLRRANEIKFPVGKMSDVEKLDVLLAGRVMSNIWLQPLSMNEKATQLCVKVCTERNWRVSVQVHQYLGLF